MLGHALRTYKDSTILMVPANSYKTMPEIMDTSFDVHKYLKTTYIPQGPITGDASLEYISTVSILYTRHTYLDGVGDLTGIV